MYTAVPPLTPVSGGTAEYHTEGTIQVAHRGILEQDRSNSGLEQCKHMWHITELVLTFVGFVLFLNTSQGVISAGSFINMPPFISWREHDYIQWQFFLVLSSLMILLFN